MSSKPIAMNSNKCLEKVTNKLQNILNIPPWNLKSVFTPLNGTFEREKTKKEEGGNIGGADSGESSDLPSIQIGDNCINYFCSGYE